MPVKGEIKIKEHEKGALILSNSMKEIMNSVRETIMHFIRVNP